MLDNHINVGILHPKKYLNQVQQGVHCVYAVSTDCHHYVKSILSPFYFSLHQKSSGVSVTYQLFGEIPPGDTTWEKRNGSIQVKLPVY